MRRNQKGFTLMELMVVIVIVAILAAVAVPLYINYVKDAQRTEAKGAIGAVITAEQTYYQLHGEYADDTFVPNPAAGDSMQALNCDLTEALKNWDIKVTDANNQGFTVTAIGKTGGSADKLSVSYFYSRDIDVPSRWEEK
jgi:prepilin-type N-terminal cleavage/methylation domain-containing protein